MQIILKNRRVFREKLQNNKTLHSGENAIMIKVTIKGNTKQFEPGTTVYEILNTFDIQFLHFACAVEMNGEIVGMDEEVVSDCDLKLLTFNDLSQRNNKDSQNDDGLPQHHE